MRHAPLSPIYFYVLGGLRGPPFTPHGGGGVQGLSFSHGKIIYFNPAWQSVKKWTFYYMFI